MFAEGQLFGRLAQRSLRDLSCAIASGSGAVTETLRKSLVFLKDRVTSAQPRVIACGPRRMLHLYTDASHESNSSGVGAVCYDSAGTELWHFGDSLSIDQVKRVNVVIKALSSVNLKPWQCMLVSISWHSSANTWM